MSEVQQTPASRKVGILLGIGIFLLPIVFAWFTLRKGHSTLSRVVSFGWMAVLVVAAALSPGSQTSAPTTDINATASPMKSPEETAAEEARKQADRWRRSPEEALELTVTRGTKTGFETILEINGTIKNAAPFDIKDAEIECLLKGPSGTEVGRVRETLYEIIPANGTKAFRELSMGFMGSQQVANYVCSIRDAVVTS